MVDIWPAQKPTRCVVGCTQEVVQIFGDAWSHHTCDTGGWAGWMLTLAYLWDPGLYAVGVKMNAFLFLRSSYVRFIAEFQSG